MLDPLQPGSSGGAPAPTPPPAGTPAPQQAQTTPQQATPPPAAAPLPSATPIAPNAPSPQGASPVQQYLTDPNFYKLSPAGQAQLLSRVDPTFGHLSPAAITVYIQQAAPQSYRMYSSPVVMTPEQQQQYTAAQQFAGQHQPTDTIAAKPAWYTPTGMKQTAYTNANAALTTLPVAGAIGGSAVGGALGAESGPGAVASSMAGSGIGQSTGRAIELGARRLIFPANSDLQEREKPSVLAGDLMLNGAEGTAFDGMGRAGSAVLNPIMKPLESAAATQALGKTGEGFSMLPSEASGSNLMRFFERFASEGIGSSARVGAFRDLQQNEALQYLDGQLRQIGLSAVHNTETPEMVGARTQQAIEGARDGLRQQEQQFYQNINDQAAQKMQTVQRIQQRPSSILDENGKPFTISQTVNDRVPTGGIQVRAIETQKVAQQLLDKVEAQRQFMGGTVLDPYISQLRPLAEGSDPVNLMTLINSRSDMLAAARRLDEAVPGKQAGLANKLASAMDSDMINGAEASGIPGLPSQLRDALAFTKELHRKFEQQAVTKILATDQPEMVNGYVQNTGLQELRDLFQPQISTGNAPSLAARPILNSTAQNDLRSSVLEGMIQSSRDPERAFFKAESFVKQIDKLGDDKGAILFGPQQWDRIRTATSLLNQISEKATTPYSFGGGGGMSLRNASMLMGGISTILAGVTGHFEGAAVSGSTLAGELAAQNMLARMLTNPKATTKLIGGLQTFLRYSPYAADQAVSAAISQPSGPLSVDMDVTHSPDLAAGMRHLQEQQ